MANLIELKSSNTATSVPILSGGGELAINQADEKLFYTNNLGTVKFLNLANPGSGAFLPLIGGTLTGALNVNNLTFSGNTVSTTDLNGNLLLSPNGTGSLDAASSLMINVLDPVSAQDAATKNYVDVIARGLGTQKDPVIAATEANVNLAATTGGALQDGVTLANGDRVLLKAQTAGAENGIYDAVTAANPSTWIRSIDADTSAEVLSGMFLIVNQGTVNADRAFILSTDGIIVLGTTALVFKDIPLSLTLLGTAGRITVSTGVVDIAATYVGQTSLTTLGTIATGTWNGTIITQAFGGTGANLSTLPAGALVKQNVGGTALTQAVAGTDFLNNISTINGGTF